MNKGIKYLAVAAVAAGTTLSSYAGNITVNWSAFDVTGVALAGGTVGVPGGDLIEIGTFSAPPTVGSPSLSGFTPWVTGLMGQGNSGGPGFFSISSGPSSAANTSQGEIYLVCFNAPTAGAATQEGIFSSSTAAWTFPATNSLTPTTTIDIENLVNNPGTSANSLAGTAKLIFGGGPAFIASDPNNAGGPSSYMQLAALVPEPSTYVLVGTGLLGLFGLRRRSRS